MELNCQLNTLQPLYHRGKYRPTPTPTPTPGTVGQAGPTNLPFLPGTESRFLCSLPKPVPELCTPRAASRLLMCRTAGMGLQLKSPPEKMNESYGHLYSENRPLCSVQIDQHTTFHQFNFIYFNLKTLIHDRSNMKRRRRNIIVKNDVILENTILHPGKCFIKH
jgi:hypothetical protein